MAQCQSGGLKHVPMDQCQSVRSKTRTCGPVPVGAAARRAAPRVLERSGSQHGHQGALDAVVRDARQVAAPSGALALGIAPRPQTIAEHVVDHAGTFCRRTAARLTCNHRHRLEVYACNQRVALYFLRLTVSCDYRYRTTHANLASTRGYVVRTTPPTPPPPPPPHRDPLRPPWTRSNPVQ